MIEHIALIKNPENNQFYRFHRICRLEECEIHIYTNKKEHYFCCTNHQQEYWKRIRQGDRVIHSEVIKQRKDIEEIKQQLGIK